MVTTRNDMLFVGHDATAYRDGRRWRFPKRLANTWCRPLMLDGVLHSIDPSTGDAVPGVAITERPRR